MQGYSPQRLHCCVFLIIIYSTTGLRLCCSWMSLNLCSFQCEHLPCSLSFPRHICPPPPFLHSSSAPAPLWPCDPVIVLPSLDGPSYLPPLLPILPLRWVRHTFLFVPPSSLSFASCLLVSLLVQWRGLAAKIGLVGGLKLQKHRGIMPN